VIVEERRVSVPTVLLLCSLLNDMQLPFATIGVENVRMFPLDCNLRRDI